MEKDMQNIQQQIGYLHSNVTRSFNCTSYFGQVKFLGCLIRPCVPFRLREDENEFTEELSGTVKSINDISKEVS